MNASKLELTNALIITATFDGTETADEAMRALARMDHGGWPKTADAAVLSRGQNGFVTAHDAHELNVLRDTLAGAFGGAVVALLMARVGPGVAGAVSEGDLAGLSRVGFSRADIDAVSSELSPGSSVLVAAVEPTIANKLMSELQKLEAKIVRQMLVRTG